MKLAQILPGAYIAYSLCNPNQSPFCCKHFLAPANIAAEHSLFQIKQFVFRRELWNLFVLFVVFKFEENLNEENETFYMAAHQISESQNVSNLLFKISRVCLINSLVFCNIGPDWKGFWTEEWSPHLDFEDKHILHEANQPSGHGLQQGAFGPHCLWQPLAYY